VSTRPDLALRRQKARAGELNPEERGGLIAEIGQAWTQDFQSLESKYEVERVPFSLEPGDVVIWHSLLAHGGSPRIDRSLSRKSAVFHYLGANTRLYSFEQFMLYSAEEFPNLPLQGMSFREYGPLRYMRFPFFTTFVDGCEIVHHLEN
jgi:hypothetical protein